MRVATHLYLRCMHFTFCMRASYYTDGGLALIDLDMELGREQKEVRSIILTPSIIIICIITGNICAGTRLQNAQKVFVFTPDDGYGECSDERP